MNHTKFKELLSTMPPCHHGVLGQPFDISQSQAFQWIMSQPGAKEWVWNRFRGTGRIEWCSKTRTWSGIPRKSHAEKPEIVTEDFS